MSLIWKDGEPTSVEFNDVYFSKEDGLEETRHVFLNCNNLPQRWKNTTKDFTIIETGFGTGLNFFASWQIWKKLAKSSSKLHFISIEKHSLSAADIKKAISNWPELSEYAEDFCKKYSPETNNSQTISLADGRVTLKIYFEDIRTTLPQIKKTADAWFLDGFAPSKNPDMWDETLYKEMSRLSTSNTSFATFTSAGIVRRGLRNNGFIVQKVTGFGKKREMLIGHK